MTNTTTSSDATPAALHHNVIPSEVGWQFVPQYYTFVNKSPNRLHCFYTKTSTFIHGTEGEDGKPCYGQQEIHAKITSIGFEDCKVFIHSVDAQSSANGGIIIQVIGEMSNHRDPWRKFVQTFFLAEQPNGYFVLNDIFRFLKEETVEGEDDVSEPDAEPEAAPAPASPAPAAAEPVAEPPAPVAAPEPEPAPAAPAVEEPPTTVIPEPIAPTPAPEPTPQKANGASAATPEAEPVPEPPVESRTPTPEPVPAPVPTPPAPSVPAPAPPPPPPAAATPPPAQPAAPSAPPAPKTWANLAATNSKKWGSAVAQESRGTTSIPSSPAPGHTPLAPASSSSSGPHQPHANGPPRNMNGGNAHPALVAAQTATTAQVFVKGVVEPITDALLTQVLTQRFGPVKGVPEIVRSKACAFLEFTTVEAARKAIIASLPPHLGGEGGIKLDIAGEAFRINVETRKERGDRPPSRPRGGAPTAGAERGAYRGRGGPGRGRGGPSATGPAPAAK
ncbi:hypothetical protein FIBSPDRAFT_874781 [Athelia psychrophila]|uniref:NTF2-domain-containing protein n=1 Tax=Athelia psychrophila TaxID=1759441 RepID=A0A165X522_9AGAM|nr:hypothetical protein FIBSPDRAFT_874781 [Fibularhizoctonia sp. CBS 109695]